MTTVGFPVARIAALLSTLVLFGGCTSRRVAVSTPGTEHSDHALAIERGRNIVAPLVRRGSGVAVAVGVAGELVWSEGFGHTRLGGSEPVRADAPFRIYSLMKQVTAVLGLQSAVRGEVDMRASVRRVLPDLPQHYEPVTLQQLLTHTAGVRHYRDASEALMSKGCTTAREALPRFVADPLVNRPGVVESYSTWGFVLASALLETAAGTPFDSLLSVRIRQPAGMTAMRLEGKDDPALRLHYHDVDAEGDVHASPAIDNSCKMGGGGFVASAEDLVRFHNAVLNGDLVPLAAVRQMLGQRTALAAAGSGPGGEAFSYVDLNTGISVVIVSNTGGLEQRIALERARDLLVSVFR